MKEIGTETFSASKVSQTGSIEYCLWVDSVGGLYFQIIGNEASGTFSNYLFSVSKYQSERASTKALGGLEAYNIETKKHEIVKDNNNGAFLKAVLRNLLPQGDTE